MTWRARFGLVLHHAAPQWRRLLAILLLTILQSVLAIAQPWPIKILADYALTDGEVPALLEDLLAAGSLTSSATTLVLVGAGLTFLLFVSTQILANLLTWLWESAGQRMVYDLSARMYRRLQWLSLSFHTRQPVGDTLTRLNSDSWSIYSATNVLLIAPLSHGLTLVFVGIAAWILSPPLAIITLVTAPLMATAAVVGGRQIKQRSRAVHDARGEMTSFVQQILTALPLVRAYGTEDHNARDFDRRANGLTKVSVGQTLADRSFQAWTGLFGALGTAVVAFLGARLVIEGSMPLGTLLVFLAYVRTLDRRTRSLLGLYAGLRTAEAGLDRVLEVIDRESDVQDPEDPSALPERADGRGRTVRFEGVSFEYEAGVAVLSDVTLEAKPGQTIALVGRTGVGKSTLVSLIARSYDPTRGRVLIDGVDVREVGLLELRQQVAVVSQDPLLLPISIADNIAYARPEATRAEVMSAARVANAHEFIEPLPEGYDTVLTERGATLSGGQRQRLAIARAVLKDSPIVILDEPTSALDSETEQIVLEALSRLLDQRTTFVIAHRLSTIRRATLIAVMDRGTIVEIGTHDELLATGAVYPGFVSRGAPTGTGAR